MATHWICLDERALLLIVVVALVRGDDDDRLHPTNPAYDIEDVGGAHHVCFVSLERLAERSANEGLCREVKDDIGLDPLDDCVNGIGVTNVGDVVINDLLEIGLRKESRRWLHLI